MDEFTRKILESEQERKEHPERFQITVICSKCGRTYTQGFPKDEVSKYVTDHGSNVMHCEECEKCAEPEEE